MKHYLLFFTTCLLSSLINAQNFTSISGFSAELNYTVLNENDGVSLIGGLENYVSYDQGVSWTPFNNSIGTNLENGEGRDAVIVNDSTYCILIYNSIANVYSIARTVDSGLTWSLPLSLSGTVQEFAAIQAEGNNIVIAAKNGIYYSIDAGVTWTFVVLSSLGEVSNFVDYNIGSNTWFVGGYSSNMSTSIDQGATWVNVNYGFNTSEIVNSSNLNNQLLLTLDQGPGGKFITIDGANAISNITSVPEELLYTYPPASEANYLPNGNILASNYRKFYIIDTSNAQVFHLNYPGVIWSGDVDISLGVTYGLAVRKHNSGTYIEAHTIDYSVPPSLYLPATINILNQSSTCAGDPISCLPYAYYADSVEWFVDGNFITNSIGLIFPTSAGVYSTYNITLNVYYNGIMKTENESITFSPPQPPHSFTYQIDSTACYNQPFHVFIDPSIGTPINTVVEVYYGGTLVAGPQTMTTANMNLYTTPITQNGTLEIISYNIGACDNTSDTITQFLVVGSDLLGFSVLPHDTAICIGINADFSLMGTDPWNMYDFSASSSIIQYASWSSQSNGVSFGTLDVSAPGFSYPNLLSSTYMDTYIPMYMYLNVQISDTLGCVENQFIDSIRVHRPSAYFDRHSRSYYRKDTAGFSNAFVTDNRTWSSEELTSSYLLNFTDTIPLIAPDTVGFFDIQLKNEPLPGCSDSVNHYVHYADSAVNIDTACATALLYNSARLHLTEMDQFGNIYEVSVNTTGSGLNNVPLYAIRKYNETGSLIWEKKAVYSGWGFNGMKGIVIEALDFDCQGNPIIGMWIQGEVDYTDYYFDFSTPFNVEETWCYIAKINKNNGNLIWKTRLNDFLDDSGTFWRITDLVVDNNRIYVSTFGHLKLEFATFDTDGNYINSTPFLFSGWSQDVFIQPGFHLPFGSGSAPQQSFWSPQLEVLSTGEVIAIGHYKEDGVPLSTYPQLYFLGSGSGMFAMKYKTNIGIYDVNLIATTGATNYSLPKFVVDNNNNIIVSSSWQGGGSIGIKVLDSVMPQNTGTFIFSMDANYNLNWLTVGTHSKVQDIEHIELTDDIYLITQSRDNISFGNGQNHMMVGETIDTVIQYVNYPNYTDPIWLNYAQSDVFLVKMNANGVPLEMKKYNDLSLDPTYGTTPYQSRIAVSKCGDLVVFHQNYIHPSGQYEVDGLVYTDDSLRAFFYYSNCTLDDCTYFNSPDTLEICSMQTSLNVQLCDYFNVDSVVYDIWEGANLVVSNQTSVVTNGSFNVYPFGVSDTMTLVFSVPDIDTTVIIYSLVTSSLTYSITGTICVDSLIQVNASNSSYNYSWLGGMYNGSNLTLDSTQYNLGLNELTVIADDGNNCLSYDTLLFVVSACAEIDEKRITFITISPNPNNGSFLIKHENYMAPYTIKLHDLNGRLLFEKYNISNNSVELSLKLEAGEYILSVLDSGNVSLEKIIIY